MELGGQVAIVTGGGRGIGRATALELARMGADLVVAELDKAGAQRTAGEVTALGRRALAVPTDVTRRADLTAMVEQTRAAFGRLDILVNNAGIYRAAPTLTITEEHWDAVLTINAKAVFFASQAALPTMIAQKSVGGSPPFPWAGSSAAGGRGERDRLPRLRQGRLHDRPGDQRRWWPRHALSALLGGFYARASFATRSCFRRCSACQRSYCVCWLSQLSEDVPKAIERRTAISGLIPPRPFRMADRVLRLTPSACAACVTVTPSGSRQRVLMISPG